MQVALQLDLKEDQEAMVGMPQSMGAEATKLHRLAHFMIHV